MPFSNAGELFHFPLKSYLFCLDLYNILTDLSSFSFTTSEINSNWNCYTSNPVLVSTCNPYHVLGGYNVFGQSDYCQISFSSLKPHYSLSVSTTLLKIDGWNSNNFLLLVDGTLQQSLTFNAIDDTGERFCATTINNDAIRPISLNISHSLTTATIKLTSDLTSSASVASWGFRDILINIDACYGSCLSCSGPMISQCLSCYSNAQLSNGQCLCNENFYMILVTQCSIAPCSICTLCNSLCKTCQGGGSIDCLSCYQNTYLLNGQCLNQCPNDMYEDSNSLTCENCDNTCLTCNISSTNCTSCASPNFLQN